MIYYILTIPIRLVATIIVLSVNIILCPLIIPFMLADGDEIEFEEALKQMKSIWGAR